MITKSYTIEITEGTAKLTTSNKNISFNQNDVGTSFIKFVCKKSDGTNENLTGLTARVCVKTPSLDADENPVVVAQDSNITIDDVNGTIEGVGLLRKLSVEDPMLLNRGVGEDS